MDEKPKKKTNNKLRNLVIDVVTLLVIVVIAIFIIIILGQRDGGITSSGSSVQVVGLHCSKTSTDSVFLDGTIPAISAQQEIRANFKDENLSDIMYSLAVDLPAGTDLSNIKTRLHANFDLAYGNAYVHRDSVWSESFTTIEGDNQARMSVYSDAGNVKSSVAAAFGLNDSSIDFPKTLSSVQKAYEAAGFYCQLTK